MPTPGPPCPLWRRSKDPAAPKQKLNARQGVQAVRKPERPRCADRLDGGVVSRPPSGVSRELEVLLTDARPHGTPRWVHRPSPSRQANRGRADRSPGGCPHGWWRLASAIKTATRYARQPPVMYRIKQGVA